MTKYIPLPPPAPPTRRVNDAQHPSIEHSRYQAAVIKWKADCLVHLCIVKEEKS